VIVTIRPSYTGIRPSVVVQVRPVEGITYRTVKPPVRPVVHQTETKCRSGKIAVERAVDIMSVIHVDESVESVEETTVVIVNI